MSEQKVGIVAECVCDLPKRYLAEHNIDIVYFLIETDSGIFTDTDEITAENILGYMQSGGIKSRSSAPEPEVYRNFFEKNLEKYDDIILVAISSGISRSCENAEKAVSEMGEKGERVHIFDSGHLSTGLGHIIMKAAEAAEAGMSADKILAELDGLRDRVCTSFITENVDFLYRSGKVSERVKKICAAFNIHPVLSMKNGVLSLSSVCFGRYEKACSRYIRRILKDSGSIDKRTAFLTYAGCNVKMLERITNEVRAKCRFNRLIRTKASATVSSNCGPGSFGILFIRNK